MISKLLLSNFRNFEEKLLEFAPSITLISGDNATGKTNILEAVHLLSTGKSFKAQRDEEMITLNAEYGRLKARIPVEDVVEGVGHTDLEVLLTRGTIERGGMSKAAPRKRLLVDGVPRRRMDFVGKFVTVLFRPQDMDLVTLSPSHRRSFLDTILSQIDREYVRSLSAYEKGVRRRNKLLQTIRDEGVSRNLLFFWDKLLIKNGEYISKRRADFLDFMNMNPELGDRTFNAVYDNSVISEERLANYAREEVASGTTLVGPHRDDVLFQMKTPLKFIEVEKYASRGEQRLAVLWAKLAELSFIEKERGVRPTLLLDDIFSELDDNHRQLIEEVMMEQQTIMTSAEKSSFGLDNIIQLS